MFARRGPRASLAALLVSALVAGGALLGGTAASAEELPAPQRTTVAEGSGTGTEGGSAPADAPADPVATDTPAGSGQADPAFTDPGAADSEPTAAPQPEAAAAETSTRAPQQAPAEPADTEPAPAAEPAAEPAPEAAAAELPAVLEAVREGGGSLAWGFKESWRNYLASPWTQGTQTPYGGATLDADGVVSYPESAASTFDPATGVGEIAYTGGVLWSSPAHGFSIALQNPRVVVAADGTATVTAETSTDDTAGAASVARIAVAVIPATGAPGTADGALAWSGVAASFAASLAPNGISRYAGQAADPFAFSTPAAAEPEPEPKPTPQVQVSQADGFDPVGETRVTVTGSGFLPDPPATSGTRPPLADRFTGVYVAFGSYAEVWQPSAGAARETRGSVDQRWAVPEESMAVIGGPAAGAIELRPDGTFEAELTVRLDEAMAVADGSWGIVTYPGGGAKHAPFETFTPIRFADPDPDPEPTHPQLAVTPSTGLSNGDTVTVRGTGYNPAQAIYVATCTDRPLAEVDFGFINDGCTDGAQLVWEHGKGRGVEFSDDGSFELTMPLVQREGSTALYTIANHTAMGDRSQDAKAELGFAAAGPSGTATVAAADETGLTVDAALADLDPASLPNGVYVGLVERGGADSATMDSIVGAQWVRTIPADGALTQRIAAAAAELDRAKQYDVLVWRGHTNPSAETNVLVLPLEVTDAQWNAVFPDQTHPAADAVLAEAGERGLTVEFTGSGFAPEAAPNGLYVAVVEAGAQVRTGTEAEIAAVDYLRSGDIRDGSFAHRLVASTDELDRTKRYEALVWRAHGPATADTTFLRASLEVTEEQWNAVFGVTPGPDPEPAAGSLEWGVRKEFREYVRGPIAHGRIEVREPATGTDTFRFPQIEGGSWDERTQTGTLEFAGGVNFTGHGGQLDLDLRNPVIVVESASKALLRVPSGEELLTIATIDLRSAEKSTLQDGSVRFADADATLTRAGAEVYFERYLAQDDELDPITFTAGGAADVDPVDPSEPKPEPKPQPKPPAERPAPVQNGVQAAGSLVWSVSGDFADYTTNRSRAGGRSGGEISTSGVGVGGGGYVFPQAAGGSWNSATQTGTVQYSGVVAFSAHRGQMHVSVSNPIISVTGPGSATMNAGGHSFGLNLAAASKSVGANGEVSWSGVPVSGGFSGGGGGGGGAFGADPLTFTVGAPSGVGYGSTTVSAKTEKRTAAATPPATTGIRVLTPAEDLVPGGEIEFEAAGYEPTERDILVVLYSDPIVLDEAAGADGDGGVRWIGTLPEDLAPGTHTITLQGSIDTGAVIEVLDRQDEDRAEKAEQTVAAAVEDGAEPMAAGVGPTAGSPAWVWWAAAAGLVLIAVAMSGLVVAQRRGAGAGAGAAGAAQGGPGE